MFPVKSSCVVAMLLIAACSTQRTELTRVISPDNSTVALLIREDSGGAAGSRILHVYLADIQDREPKGKPSFSATRCDEVNLIWGDARKLHVEYQQSCNIRRFHNKWYLRFSSDEELEKSIVEIILVRREVPTRRLVIKNDPPYLMIEEA